MLFCIVHSNLCGRHIHSCTNQIPTRGLNLQSIIGRAFSFASSTVVLYDTVLHYIIIAYDTHIVMSRNVMYHTSSLHAITVFLLLCLTTTTRHDHFHYNAGDCHIIAWQAVMHVTKKQT